MQKNLQLNKDKKLSSPISSENDSDVTREERELLSKTDRPETDESKDLEKLALDKIGNEDRVNEKGDLLDMGADLDIPGSELDDEQEEIGGEDEENNSYSQPD